MNNSRGAVSVAVSEMGFHHGTIEGYVNGACRCEGCRSAASAYCSPDGAPACVRLPGHAGKCSGFDKDRTLDMLERELWSLNFSSMHRHTIRDIVRSYQS